MLGVGKLLVGVGAGVLIFLEAVVVFRPAVAELRLGVLDERIPSGLPPQLHGIGEGRLPGVHGGGIGLGEGVVVIVHGEIDLGEVVCVVARLRQEEKARHGAVSQRGGTTLDVEVLGAVAKPHQHVGILGEGALVLVVNGQRFAQVVLGEEVVVAQNFVGLFGHAPGGEHHLVDLLQELMGLEHQGFSLPGGEQILAHRSLGLGDTVHGGKVGDILIGEAYGGQELIVIEVGLAQVIVAGLGHGRARQAQAAEKPHTQGDDGQNGQKTPQGM